MIKAKHLLCVLVGLGLGLVLGLGLAYAAGADTVFTAHSPKHRVALLELYTSQGCSSCPPTDRWVRELEQNEVTGDQLVPIALHVDYWDHLGWKDPFGDPSYQQRQRITGARNQLRTIYTPQLVLNGKDFRRRASIHSSVDEIVRQSSLVDLSLTARYASPQRLDAELRVSMAAGHDGRNISAYLALVENSLESVIQAGENRGRTLRYDNVVRELAGPFDLRRDGETLIDNSLKVGSDMDKRNLQLVAFVQDEHDGDVLQTLRLPLN